MRIRLLSILIFLTLFAFTLTVKAVNPTAVKGILDLRKIKDPDHFTLNLNGEWEFYWKKMLRPNDFLTRDIKPDYYGKVPSYWNKYPKKSVKTEKFGYATYRLTIILPPGFNNPLAVDMPVFNSSYDIYINGKYLGGNGTTGVSADETKPEYNRVFLRFMPNSDSVSIVINISNYEHRLGGFWFPVKFGTFSEVQKPMANGWAGAWSDLSILMGFSIFFLFFFLIYPREKTIGFFSIATFGLAFRPLFTSHFLILNIFDMPWVWIVRCEYLGLYLIIISWAWFILTLYPSKFFRIITYVLTGIFVPASILTLFLPVRIFSYSILISYPSILVVMVYPLYKSIKGTLKKNVVDIMYLMAFLIMFLGGLHDMKVNSGNGSDGIGYVFTYLVVVFVFIQAAIIMYKWVTAFQEKEKLQNQLEFMNRNLELLVNERTQELKTRNEEIITQNKKIELQNTELSDTILLKNRIFSVIAHDLRSPVVNILYMLNLLKEKEYKEKYDTFADSSIQYAQLVISLLENMLVWGRGQEDKIKLSPEQLDLANIILTNLSIFKATADKKDISVNFTQVGSSKAYVDKDLIDIIIRNLLSNAVKYTPRGGRISILLKNKEMYEEGTLLKICDNGIGIPENKIKELFTSAEIESTPGTENEKGTGLGLKLCQELVKLNNGKLAIESKAGEGTCIIISLPSKRSEVILQ
jgi:signal transduction histidine kinase